MPSNGIKIRGLRGIPEILPGMDLGEIILKSLISMGIPAASPTVLVVAQKVVSKAEGCLVRLQDVIPSSRAQIWAEKHHKDARMVEVVLQQARRIVRMDRGIIIAETHHGFVCANAGVDASNAPSGTVICLPRDPDRSADQLRLRLEQTLKCDLAVIISDTFGRPWRTGLTNVALGISGISPFIDYRGHLDSFGRTLQATMLAIADEIAGAAELVMGKTSGIPAAIVEGFPFLPAEGNGRQLLRNAVDDLFR